MHKTSALTEEVENEVNAVICMGHCHVADSRAFLDSILPVDDDIIKGQLKILEQSGDLKRKKGKQGFSWTHFPKSEKTQQRFYKPLVDLGNMLCARNEKDGGVDGRWGNLFDRAPQSGNEGAFELGPDVGRVALTDLKHLKEDWSKIKVKYDDLLKNPAKKRKEDLDTLEKLFKRFSAVWWMQLLVPVEVKNTSTMAEITKAIRQLACYMRQILCAQLDRRFVIGLIVCGKKFSVWLCDRSGLFGMKYPIDYHEYPKLFVQALIALNRFTPKQLGFDRTMKVFSDKRRVEIIPSYKRPYHRELEADQLNMKFVEWIIEMTVNSKTEKYVTIKPLSVTGAENISGRATIVWEAVKFEERDKPQQIFVIKQYWRTYKEDNEGPILSEGELLGVAGIGERLVAHEDVKIESIPDTTLIKNLPSEANPTAATEETELPDRPVDHDTQAVQSLQTPTETWLSCWDARKLPFECRVLNRMSFRIWGFPLKFFKDRVELLAVMLHAVQDHYRFFFERKLLHRDVSPGNILIRPTWEEDHYHFSNTKGVLIDLDQSKVAKSCKEPVKHSHSDLEMTFFRNTTLEQAVDSVYIHASDIIANSWDLWKYLNDSIGIRSGEPPYTCASLGWPDRRVPRPDFENRASQKATKTGTVPYMSAEVLDPSRSICLLPCAVFHDAVHDMESFYWILLEIALTCKPGNVQRRDLNTDPQLRVLVDRIFINSSDASAKIKASYLKNETDYNMQDVIEKVDPYFDFLKPFLNRWWKTLQVAYRFRAYEYEIIHTHVMNILEEALEEARKLTSFEFHETADVDRKRKYYQRLCNSLKGDVTFPQTKKAKVDQGMDTGC